MIWVLVSLCLCFSCPFWCNSHLLSCIFSSFDIVSFAVFSPCLCFFFFLFMVFSAASFGDQEAPLFPVRPCQVRRHPPHRAVGAQRSLQRPCLHLGLPGMVQSTGPCIVPVRLPRYYNTGTIPADPVLWQHVSRRITGTIPHRRYSKVQNGLVFQCVPFCFFVFFLYFPIGIACNAPTCPPHYVDTFLPKPRPI